MPYKISNVAIIEDGSGKREEVVLSLPITPGQIRALNLDLTKEERLQLASELLTLRYRVGR